MKRSIIKEKRYKKAMNIKKNNLPKDIKNDYDCTRKNGLVRIHSTKADKKSAIKNK